MSTCVKRTDDHVIGRTRGTTADRQHDGGDHKYQTLHCELPRLATNECWPRRAVKQSADIRRHEGNAGKHQTGNPGAANRKEQIAGRQFPADQLHGHQRWNE